MFTDDQVTPVRLEIVLDVLHEFPRGISRESLSRLLQPKPLAPTATPAARAAIRAAIELEIAEEKGESIALNTAARKLGTRAAILGAFDRLVLSDTQVEPYFAKFYAYHLGLGKEAYAKPENREAWANDFNEIVFAGVSQSNPFNTVKLTGLHRWFSYVGLGWFDPKSNFQPNPYDRVRRVLPTIFDRKKKMESEDFMARLAEYCPELDSGRLFLQANPNYDSSQKKCTLGLSHALIELDLDRALRLYRPADSSGWSIEEAKPPIGDDADSKGERLSFVELIESN